MHENLYRSGEARLKQIKAEFNVSTNQASYAVLRAPQDGVVAKRAVEVGQVVAAGQTVFTLATDGEREVLISLPEQSFGRFKVGQPVSVELWTQPDQRFAGRIRELSPAADPKSRTFAARIAFTAGKVPAELGQSARVFVQTAEAWSAVGAAFGADRGKRRDLRLGRQRQQHLEENPGAGRRLRRENRAGARRPERQRLGGGRRCPCASRRAAGAPGGSLQPRGQSGGQGVIPDGFQSFRMGAA